MLRYLALDVGEKRIGIAVSDLMGMTAQGLATFNRTGDINKDANHIASMLESYKPVKLVVGLPRNMDGSYGFQCDRVKEFATEVLARWEGECDYYDERLTTAAAQKMLISANMSREKRRKVVDKIAAQIILQGYLETKR